MSIRSKIICNVYCAFFSSVAFTFYSADGDGGSWTIYINACNNPVTFNAPVGATSPPASITIDLASDLNINSTMVTGSLIQTAGTGTTTIASSLNTTAGGIDLDTVAIAITGNLITTSGGPVTFNNSGAFTLSGGTIEIDGAFQQTGAGSVSIGGAIETTDDIISFASAVTLTNNLTLDTVSSTGANITFTGTVDGGYNFNLAAGTADIHMVDDVGVGVPLSIFTVSSAHNVTADMAVSAASIVQSAGTGKTTFTGAVNTTALAGISLTGSQFEFDGAVATTNGGPVAITNSGALTWSGGGTIAGALTQTGAGTVSLTGTTTVGAAVSFSSAVSLAGTTSLDTSANGTNITFLSTINGGQNLTLNLGTTGNLTLTGAVGGITRLGALTITNANNVTAAAITAASITQSAGSGTSTFGSLNTNAIGGISLTGTVISINGNLSTTNLGPVTITNSGALTLVAGASTSITGAFIQNGAGAVSLSGTILTANTAASFLRAVTLTGTTSVSTGSGAGTITFSSTINGNNNLTLTAGTGDIVFGSTIGQSSALGALTVQSCTNITYPTTTANSVTQNASSGTTTLSSAISTTGSSGIAITGTTITQSSSLSTAGTGAVAITNSSTYTMGGTISSAGSFAQSGGGSVNLNGTITTSSANLSFANAIGLTGTSTLSTGAGAGNIILSGTVNGGNNLSLSAGTGSITFSSEVGGITRIGALTINSGVSNTTGAITAASLSQLAGSTTFGALDTNGASGISLIGSTFTLGGDVTTTGTGPLSIQNTGAVTLSGTTFSINGAVTQAGAGGVTLGSAITAAGAIQFAGAITASGGSLNTAVAGTNITLLSTVNGSSSGVGALTLNAGTLGNISISGDIGATTRMGSLTFTNANNITVQNITAASISQAAGQGTSTFLNLNTSAVAGISLSGTVLTINGNLITTTLGPVALVNTGALSLTAGASTSITGAFSQSGGGTVSLSGTVLTVNTGLSFANAITLAGTTALSTSGGAGNITLSSTVNGAFALTLTAGTGNITASGAIGGTTPGTTRIGAFTVTSCTNFTGNGLTAASVNITETGGTVTSNAGINTDTAAGIILNANNIIRGGSITATNGGPLTVTFSGTSIATGLFAINVGSLSITSTGVGSINFGGTVTTDTGGIDIYSPVNLAALGVVNTSGPGGDIHFYSTVNGNKDITLVAGAGNIYFDGVVGGSTPLTSLTISSANAVTASAAVLAGYIVQTAGTGTTTFNGALTTTGASGINLTGANFSLHGNVTTTGGGQFTVANSSSLTIAPSLTFSLTGPFSQTGAGPISMGGTLTTSGSAIGFSSAIILTGNLSLNSGNGNVTLGNDLDGAHSVSITAGTGDVTMPSGFSIETPLQNFTVVSAHDISLNGVGSPTAIMSGTLSLTASNTISLTNTIYAAHAQTYSSGADLDFINPGLVTLLTDGGAITFSSAVAHLNNGTDLLIQTNGGEFSFNSIHGTNFENLTIDTGSGLASLGTLPNIASINTVTVTAGSVLLNGSMDLVNPSFTSQNSILNAGAPVDITSSNTAFFNALNGNVGTLSSPILVHSSQQIIAGGVDLADFNGSSIDNTVNEYAPNPPCVIYFNGVKIKDCGGPPPPPPPSPAPAPVLVSKGDRLFAVVGVYDSQFTLASDYFFFTYFLEKWRRSVPFFVPIYQK